MHNPNSLDTICAALTYALGIPAPQEAAPKNSDLAGYVDKIFNSEKADRIIMYNPDAIAQWIYEKYPHFFESVTNNTDIEVPKQTGVTEGITVESGTSISVLFVTDSKK